MITRASRLFFGLSAAGFVAAIVYGLTTESARAGAVGDTLSGDGAVNAVLGALTLGYKGGVGERVGYAVLIGFTLVCLGLGVMTSAFRDGDPRSVAQVMGLDEAPAVTAPSDAAVWPVVGAVGAAVATIGLATTAVAVAVGIVLMLIAGVEWAVKSWSEQATADPEVNRTVRDRMMRPLEYPIAGVIVLGFIAVGVSRLFLSSSESMAIVWALVFAAAIFVIALIVNVLDASTRKIVLGAALAIGAVIVLGVGIYGAATGEREFEVHGEEHGAVTIESSAHSGESA